jgi:hypothetical protein
MKIDKARLDLIPPEALYAMAAAFEDGAKKRSERNWEVGTDRLNWSVLDRIAAIQRHTLRLTLGEDLAPDSGLHHAAHILANAAMLLTMYERGDLGKDDRFIGRT